MKKAFKYMGVVFVIVGVFVAIACYKYLSSDNEVGPNLITAFVGVVISALVTLVLLNGQTKDEEEKERNLNLYKAKQKVYSGFVLSWYNALRDDQITETELRNLRTILFGKVFFYVENQDVYKEINEKLKDLLKKNDKLDANDSQMRRLFLDIETILQNDLNGLPMDDPERNLFKDIQKIKKKINKKTNKIIKYFKPKGDLKQNEDLTDLKRSIFSNFNKVIENTKGNTNQLQTYEDAVPKQTKDVNNDVGNKQNERGNSESNVETNNVAEQNESTSDDSQRLENTWHFNAWGDQQFKQFKEPFDKSKEIELSLVEYGEYWRTNLLKQVGKGDIIMLFRRGGYGYVGAFEAIGRRIFDFEKGVEEILYFGEDKPRTVENFNADVEKYDIYKSKEDGATLCSNLIVKCIAYVPEGVGNPGGVYRRTISRYDSHYAWLLRERFQKKGQ